MGLVEIMILCEELGAHVAPVPFLGTVLTRGRWLAMAVRDGAALGGVDVGTWLERLGTGAAVGALAWSRRPQAVRAVRHGADQWRLSGRSDPVVYGPAADVVVAWAAETDEGEVGLFAFAQNDTERPPPEPAMDRTRSLGWHGAPGPTGVTDRFGLNGPRHCSTGPRERCAAEMLGAAQRVLDMTVEYAKDRVQFGRPIGSFQAVKHRCADMLVDVEGMRSSTYYAAWAVGAGDPDAHCAASAAKVWGADAARRVMASGLQVHGGIGFTWEHDLHLFLKRSQLDQMSFGDADLSPRPPGPAPAASGGVRPPRPLTGCGSSSTAPAPSAASSAPGSSRAVKTSSSSPAAPTTRRSASDGLRIETPDGSTVCRRAVVDHPGALDLGRRRRGGAGHEDPGHRSRP